LQQFNGRFVFGDFNNDGKIDVLNQVSNSSGQGITLYLNNGDGTFTAIAKPNDSSPGAGDAPFTSGPFTGVDFTQVLTQDFLVGDFTNNGAVDIVDSQSNASRFITETLPPPPTISSSSYDASTGHLTVTGTGFMTSAGDYSATALTLTGEGGNTYTLTGGSIEANPTATTFVVDLSTADQLAIDGLLNKNGTSSVGLTTFNLAATTSFDTGGAADTTSAVTVSNALAPTISAVAFDYATGVLTLTGTGFENQGGTGGLRLGDLTLTGQGGAGAAYTLAAANAAVTSETSASITLSGNDLTRVKALFDKNGTASPDGTTYNLASAPHWDANAGAVTVSGVTVSGVTPTISSAAYDASTAI
jgi:hypothetical protein